MGNKAGPGLSQRASGKPQDLLGHNGILVVGVEPKVLLEEERREMGGLEFHFFFLVIFLML